MHQYNRMLFDTPCRDGTELICRTAEENGAVVSRKLVGSARPGALARDQGIGQEVRHFPQVTEISSSERFLEVMGTSAARTASNLQARCVVLSDLAPVTRNDDMRAFFAVAVVVFAILVPANKAWSLGGDLKSPEIAGSGYTRDEVTAARIKVLSDKKFNFAGGYFVNETTHLVYSGDAASLSSFLRDLTAVRGTLIHVSFSKETTTATSPFGTLKNRGPAAQWTVFHSARHPNEFELTIYLGDGKIDISKLVLPPIGSLPSLRR
jgi:hypothetical protein